MTDLVELNHVQVNDVLLSCHQWWNSEIGAAMVSWSQHSEHIHRSTSFTLENFMPSFDLFFIFIFFYIWVNMLMIWINSISYSWQHISTYKQGPASQSLFVSHIACWPETCKTLVSVGSNLVNTQKLYVSHVLKHSVIAQ